MNSWELQQARNALEAAGFNSVALLPKTQFSNPVTVDHDEGVPSIDVQALHTALGITGFSSDWNGSKYPGGFGATRLYELDYWALRERSGQMFTENQYARGIIRRLVTNEINTGLSLEATPEELTLGYAEDELSEWTENVENRHALWGKNPRYCDHSERLTFGATQRAARMEALISGDVLAVCRIDKSTGLPRTQLVSGALIRTPLDEAADPLIVEGVKTDKDGRHVGFYVDQLDGTSKFLPAYDSATGRKLAWLVYGTQNRVNKVRGEPLLSIILQTLKEIDRFKDATLRKAVINSMLAMFIKKDQDKPGTLPITGGAIRKGGVTTVEAAGARSFGIMGLMPGLVIEELQQGETPVPGSTAGTDVNWGPFEEIAVAGMSWCLEIPPEILRLSFSNNYSASQAAINEFKIYLNRVRTEFGEDFCQPYYIEFLIAETLSGKIAANGFLRAWRDPKRYDEYTAWISSDWSGAIKPSTDILKQAKGYKELIGEGWITNDRASRELTGTKFSKNIKRIKRENELKVAAATPLAEFKQKFGVAPDEEQDKTIGALLDAIAELGERLDALDTNRTTA